MHGCFTTNVTSLNSYTISDRPKNCTIRWVCHSLHDSLCTQVDWLQLGSATYQPHLIPHIDTFKFFLNFVMIWTYNAHWEVPILWSMLKIILIGNIGANLLFCVIEICLPCQVTGVFKKPRIHPRFCCSWLQCGVHWSLCSFEKQETSSHRSWRQ